MLLKRISRKAALFIMSISMIFVMFSSLNIVGAMEKEINPYSIETYTVTKDYGLGDDGYVTCKVKIDRNIQSSTSRVVNVTVTPHFSSAKPLLMMVGTPTSTPSSGSLITNGYVDVHFKYGLRFMGIDWSRTCRIYI